MTTVNHWDKWVDSETPVTGVEQNNHLGQGFFDELFNGIDIDLEAYESENPEGLSDEDMESTLESWDGSSDTILIGSWVKDEHGKYMPDKAGEYSAIVGEIYTQVVWSTVTRRCALCSPCYPGQGDADTPGEFLTYVLPDDMRDNDQ